MHGHRAINDITQAQVHPTGKQVPREGVTLSRQGFAIDKPVAARLISAV